MNNRIVVLPGDGIGPEVIREAVRVVKAAAEWGGAPVEIVERSFGGQAIEALGTACPEGLLEECRRSSAVLLGAVGGPRWDDRPLPERPERALLGLRKGLGLYANLRPVRSLPLPPGPASPRRRVDLVIVRELTGGLYFSEPRGRSGAQGAREAVDTLRYAEGEIARLVRRGFELARTRRKEVTSVDKANVLESSRLWREVTEEVAQEFPDVTLRHLLVDSCALRLVTCPEEFDVLVTENLFGDILSDEAAGLVGSLGVLPSASLGSGAPGLYEPVHGSAPDIAGTGVADPLGAILAAAALFRHSLGREREAEAIERAVDATVAAGVLPRDLGGSRGTQEVADAVLARLPRTLPSAGPECPGAGPLSGPPRVR